MRSSIILLFLVTLIVFAQPLLAQEPGTFDWGLLGVDMVIVVVIITAVQAIKRFLPVNEIYPLLLSIILSIVAGIVFNLGQPVTDIIKIAFAYATAAAFTYSAAKAVGVPLKGIKALNEGKH